jgi:hypothetical protein
MINYNINIVNGMDKNILSKLERMMPDKDVPDDVCKDGTLGRGFYNNFVWVERKINKNIENEICIKRWGHY